MRPRSELESEVLRAAAEYGIGAIVFRNALAKKLGLNLTESLCLTILGTRGSSTPTELARFTGLSTGSTTTMLDRLERRNFIRRTPNPADRRGVIVEVDGRYAKVARKLVAGIQASHREVIASYSAKDLAVIADFLTRFAANMTHHAGELEEREQ